MKHSYISTAIIALASMSFVAGEHRPVYVTVPPAVVVVSKMATVTRTATASVVVEDTVYVQPSNKPNQLPQDFKAPVPLPSPYRSSTPSPGGPAPIESVSTPVASGPAPSKKAPVPVGNAPAPVENTPAPVGGAQSTKDHICINFAVGDFHFANAAPWPTKSGSGAEEASQCFDRVAGGAMFICESECNASGDSSPAKYTKLECNFGEEHPNCDISLVDGYSLPLECTIPGGSPPKIGGTADLASGQHKCVSTAGDNTCGNSRGYENDGNLANPPVDPFFHQATTNDPLKFGPMGNYCVWQNCSVPSDSFWDPTSQPTISCTVGSRKASKKRDLEEIEPRNIAEVEARAMDQSLVERRIWRQVGGVHAHAIAYAKSLKAMLA